MADWTNISDSAVDPDAPLTSELAYAWRDNPIAIAEGSLGAPYMQTSWHPYNGYEVGDGATGRIWSFDVDGAVASIVSPDFIAGYEYRFIFDEVDATNAIRINPYRNTSAAYAGVISILRLDGTTTINQNATGYVDVLRAGLTAKAHLIDMAIDEAGGDAVNPATGAADRMASVTHTTKQRLLRVEYSPVSGTFNAGAIYMHRRLIHA